MPRDYVLFALVVVSCGGNNLQTGSDAAAPDGSSDVNMQPEGGADTASDSPADVAETGIQPTYYDITDASNWEVFDLPKWMMMTFSQQAAFVGGAFDGRYVYYVPRATDGPGTNNQLVRYDTTGAFTAQSSWAAFDMSQIMSNVGFIGATFDGTDLELSPSYLNTNTSVYNTNAVRFIPASGFTSTGAYQLFDVTTIPTADTNLTTFSGSAFDGRYVYFPPSNGENVAMRYDSTASFTTAASWSKVNVSSLVVGTNSYVGAAFDGRYVYFAGSQQSTVLQLDTTGTFTDLASWKAESTSVTELYAGAVFDGRYMYIVPEYWLPDGTAGNEAVRYDTTAPFESASSWSTSTALYVAMGSGQYFGGLFDGRYIYYLPTEVNVDSTNYVIIARYDTTGAFGDTSAWSSMRVDNLDVTTETYTTYTNGGFYEGGAFDGKYVYLIPGTQEAAVRFKAKTPASLPAAYHGSFL